MSRKDLVLRRGCDVFVVKDQELQERLLFPQSNAAKEENCIQRLAKEALARLEVADGRRQQWRSRERRALLCEQAGARG